MTQRDKLTGETLPDRIEELRAELKKVRQQSIQIDKDLRDAEAERKHLMTLRKGIKKALRGVNSTELHHQRDNEHRQDISELNDRLGPVRKQLVSLQKKKGILENKIQVLSQEIRSLSEEQDTSPETVSIATTHRVNIGEEATQTITEQVGQTRDPIKAVFSPSEEQETSRNASLSREPERRTTDIWQNQEPVVLGVPSLEGIVLPHPEVFIERLKTVPLPKSSHLSSFRRLLRLYTTALPKREGASLTKRFDGRGATKIMMSKQIMKWVRELGFQFGTHKDLSPTDVFRMFYERKNTSMELIKKDVDPEHWPEIERLRSAFQILGDMLDLELERSLIALHFPRQRKRRKSIYRSAKRQLAMSEAVVKNEEQKKGPTKSTPNIKPLELPEGLIGDETVMLMMREFVSQVLAMGGFTINITPEALIQALAQPAMAEALKEAAKGPVFQLVEAQRHQAAKALRADMEQLLHQGEGQVHALEDQKRKLLAEIKHLKQERHNLQREIFFSDS